MKKSWLLLTVKIRKFSRLSCQKQLLLLYTLSLLIICHSCVNLLPFRIICTVFRLKHTENPIKKSIGSKHRFEQIRWAIRIASGNIFLFNVRCLAQSLTAKILLKHFGEKSILHLGVMIGENQSMLAHAWIKCADGSTIGEHHSIHFNKVASYI